MESTYLIGLGWILGLLSRYLPVFGTSWGWVLPMLGGLVGAGLTWRRPPLARTFWVAGLVSLLAWIYLGYRIPAPGEMDISRFVPSARTTVTVVGKVLTDPQRTRSNRERFWLETMELVSSDQKSQPVTGKVYTTTNPKVLEKIDVYPSQIVRIKGALYLPSPAANPGGFDFKEYLAGQGSFAGLSAYEITEEDPGQAWGGWSLRRRIRGALVAGLGPIQGELLSSIVLGSKAAELDYELSDNFRRVGLSHVLAASGFHVSLLIAVVLALVNKLSPRQQQLSAMSTLGAYILLTGFSASVVRAALMGVAAIFLLTESNLREKIRLEPLGLLLLAAVIILVWQPTWIINIGFQLSFAATLGLLVSVKPFEDKLNWLPVGLAVPTAVSLAAQLWTLPMQMLFFGQIPNYSLIANLVTLMFVTVLSVLGFGVCTIALISPAAGALVSAPLTYVLTPMINIVAWIASWPRATYYVGQVSWIQCVLLYGALCGMAFWPLWRERVRVWGTAVLMIVVLWIPNLLPGPAVQITALATGQAPVLVIQTRQEVVVINSGSTKTVDFTLLPFLRTQGIGNIDHAIATAPEGNLNAGWLKLLEEGITVKTFWSGSNDQVSGVFGEVVNKLKSNQVDYRVLRSSEILTTSSLIELQALNANPVVLGLKVNTEGSADWLLLGTASAGVQSKLSGLPTPLEWVWWDGGALSSDLLKRHQVSGGITSNGWQEELPWFQEGGRALYDTERDGAITWTPPNQIKTLEAGVE